MCLSSREREQQQQQRRAAAKGGRHKCSSPWLFFFRKHVADVAGLFPRAAAPRAVGPPGGWPTWRPFGADAVSAGLVALSSSVVVVYDGRLAEHGVISAPVGSSSRNGL